MARRKGTAPIPAAGRLAVVDLGSNSVRMVVFDGPARIPVPVFNEKVVCGLGRGLPKSRRLNEEGVEMAIASLGRFVELARAMGVMRLDLLATAAVREASDGPAFVAEIKRRFGLPVEVLSGAEESRLAALGVVCGLPTADGLMGDLGGGSLDLVTLDGGAFGDHASLPLGLLWLNENAEGDPAKARAIVDGALAELPWLGAIAGRALFPVGGAWRTLGGILISQSGYPLHILDNYTIGAREAADLVGMIAGLGPKTLERIPGVSQRRLDTLPLAALLLARLLERAKPGRVVFSAYGMREGQFFKCLPAEVRAEDPLIGACAELAQRHRRFGLGGEELAAWTAPLFADEGDADRRLRLAACHLSDIAWAEHPDYRGHLAFEQVLRLPFAGLSHRDRALVALSVSFRYGGEVTIGPVARSLLDDAEQGRARTLGTALRLGYTLTGGTSGLLARTRLACDDTKLTLTLPLGDGIFAGDVIERRLQALARAMDVKGVIKRARPRRRRSV